MTPIRGRYMEVDACLEHIGTYLTGLAVELGETGSGVDPCGDTCRAAMRAADKVDHLRYMLAVSEARWEIAEKRGSTFVVQSAGATTGLRTWNLRSLWQRARLTSARWRRYGFDCTHIPPRIPRSSISN